MDVLVSGEYCETAASPSLGASDDEARGESGRKGPSRALAGDTGLLPGMVSSPSRVAGCVGCSGNRVSRRASEASELSRVGSVETLSRR